MADHSPDHAIQAFLQFDGLVAGVIRFRIQVETAAPSGQPLDRHFVVDRSDHDHAGLGIQCPVDHQDVVVGEACARHGVARDADEESRLGMGDAELVEIEALLDVIVSRRGEACPHPRGKQRQFDTLEMGRRDKELGA